MTVTLIDLWLPIVVSAVAVFVASFVAYMMLPYHRKDWSKAANEDGLLETVRGGIEPGQYMFPHCGDWSEMKDPEKKARYEAGPHGTITVWPGMPNMGRNLVLTFLFYILVGVMVAYLAAQAIEQGADFKTVLQFAGTAGIMSHVLGILPGAIWYRKKGSMLVGEVFDGIVFGLITGAVFAWLWPSATLPV